MLQIIMTENKTKVFMGNADKEYVARSLLADLWGAR